MQKNILNRWIIIAITIIFAILLIVNDLKFYSNKDSQNTNFLFDSKIINLGLDLRGGTEYLLSPKIDRWLLSHKDIDPKKKTFLTKSIRDFNDKNADNLENAIFDFDSLKKYLQSPIETLLVGDKTEDDLRKDLKASLENNKNVIQSRIDDKGIVEPSVRVVGERISVEIPGKQTTKELEDLITSSALLEFSALKYGIESQKEVKKWAENWNDLEALTDTIPEIGWRYLKKENVIKFKERVLLKEVSWFKTHKFAYLNPELYLPQLLDTNILKDGDRLICVLYKNIPNLKGEHVLDAAVQSDGTLQNQYNITLNLRNDKTIELPSQMRKYFQGNEPNEKKSPTEVWAEYTGSNLGKVVAITLDDEILTAPTIQARIDEGGSIISGFENYSKAENITITLNNSKFEVPLQKEYEYKSGPELGAEMIYLGSFAFIIGIVCIIIFMIIYYKISGIVASTALIINVIIMIAVLSFLGATLTLPGIAGFILTIGIAVDANVIIFERIKEEIRKGNPPLSAIELGYDRAFITILDANITTLLTAIILYLLGTGPIKGFAITLGCGILASMFTAIYVTRTIYGSLYYSKSPKKLSI